MLNAGVIDMRPGDNNFVECFDYISRYPVVSNVVGLLVISFQSMANLLLNSLYLLFFRCNAQDTLLPRLMGNTPTEISHHRQHIFKYKLQHLKGLDSKHFQKKWSKYLQTWRIKQTMFFLDKPLWKNKVNNYKKYQGTLLDRYYSRSVFG